MVGLVLAIGFSFFSFSSQGQSAAEYYADSAKLGFDVDFAGGPRPSSEAAVRLGYQHEDLSREEVGDGSVPPRGPAAIAAEKANGAILGAKDRQGRTFQKGRSRVPTHLDPSIAKDGPTGDSDRARRGLPDAQADALEKGLLSPEARAIIDGHFGTDESLKLGMDPKTIAGAKLADGEQKRRIAAQRFPYGGGQPGTPGPRDDTAGIFDNRNFMLRGDFGDQKYQRGFQSMEADPSRNFAYGAGLSVAEGKKGEAIQDFDLQDSILWRRGSGMHSPLISGGLSAGSVNNGLQNTFEQRHLRSGVGSLTTLRLATIRVLETTPVSKGIAME